MTFVFRTSEITDAANDYIRIKNTIQAAADALALPGSPQDAIATVILDSPEYNIDNSSDPTGAGFLIPDRVHIDSPIRALIKNHRTNSTYQYGITFVPNGDDISIRNIRFEASGSKPQNVVTPPIIYGNYHGAPAILQKSGGNRFVLENCEFSNYPNAVYFSGNLAITQESETYKFPIQIRISNNIFHGGNGLLVRCFKELLFEGNMSDLITDTTNDPFHQIYVTDRSAGRSGALVISNCIDYNTQGVGESWKIRNVSNVIVVGCNSYLASRGIVADSCDNVTISSCRIGELRPGLNANIPPNEDTQAAGIQLWDCPNSTVSDCVVSTSRDVRCYRVRKTLSYILGDVLGDQTSGGGSIKLPASFVNATEADGQTSIDWTNRTIKVYQGPGSGQVAKIISYDHSTGTATLEAPGFNPVVDNHSYIGSYDPANENNIFRDCTAVLTQAAGFGMPAFAVEGGGNVLIESPTIFYRSDIVHARAFYCANAHNVIIDRPRVFVQPKVDWSADKFIYFSPTAWDCLALLDQKLLAPQALTAGVNTGNSSNIVYGGIAIVTPSGTTNITAAPLTATHNIVTSAAANAGLRLPFALAGMECTVRNHSSASIKVYPHVGGQLNLGAADFPVSLSADTTMTFVAQSSSQWYS